MTSVTCGLVIYSEKERRVRTCGAPATHSLIFNGDHLFGTCPRHNARLSRAIPALPARQAPKRIGGSFCAPIYALDLPA